MVQYPLQHTEKAAAVLECIVPRGAVLQLDDSLPLRVLFCQTTDFQLVEVSSWPARRTGDLWFFGLL
ncbi:Hypothetical protein FKW44_012676 [Caligus rogercresseyi]|uniref:Uncharacterized protein n=1 Tax=Caligus rogercresseyi TaxID=217165 RepID=A0A7T8HK42_CALRO|nr:Hypothetical protein FKW44_012676 [Caligus rogercresseyi]